MTQIAKIIAGFVSLLFYSLVAAEPYTLEECKQKAAVGEAEACWQLGQRYENGNGVRKSAVKAVAQYRKAAEMRHKKACGRLASLYETGTYVKRDQVLAAKYKAWSQGEDGVFAELDAQADCDRKSVDEIEKALDYILGRNGKARDSKAGIRILYDAAKDNPVAQKVFVKRWSEGDLDDALSELSEDEWEMLIPWFKEAFADGVKSAGQILGLDAHKHGKYNNAAKYFRVAAVAGSAKCWVLYAKLYDEGRTPNDGGSTQAMQSDVTAKNALEEALKIDGLNEEALYMMAVICAHSSKKKCVDYRRARDIFKNFYNRDNQNIWYSWNYGYAGLMNVCSVQYENMQQMRSDLVVHSYAPSVRQSKYKRYIEMKEVCVSAASTWIPLIEYAENNGCEPAKKFMQEWRK